MKKTFAIMLVLSILVLTSACSNDTENTASLSLSSSSTIQSNSESSESSDEINVDKNLLSVEITIPSSMISEDKEYENTNEMTYTKNLDGSVTCRMTKQKHLELMKQLHTTTASALDEMATSGDYSSIKKVEYNDDFTKISVIVDKESFNKSMDALAGFVIYTGSSMYQLFDGKGEGDIKCEISFKDEATGEVFNSVVYPDALKK